MIDIQLLRDNPEFVAKKATEKGYPVDIAGFAKLDKDRRELLQQVEGLRARRNEIASRIKGGRPSDDDINEGKQVKVELAERERYLQETEASLKDLLESVPNMPLDDVPVGESEEQNQVVKTVGEIPHFDFSPKNHAELAEAKGWLDKGRAAKVAGARFAYLKGDLVMLDWAMNMYALKILTNEQIIGQLIKENDLGLSSTPFIPVQPPAVAKTDVFLATGRLDGEQQTYKLADDDLWLNASAEHVLAPMYLNEVLQEHDLPIRLVGYTTAFRREAGTYGKDMEGFFRLHQFNKLEMESFTTPESSYEEHLLMIAIQEYLMQQLGLPYQVVLKCTADIGKPNARGVDIDTWLPAQNTYRETHTADLITDYQTRRMNTRVKKQSGEIVFAHTNDATALSQRPLIAILENYQTAEGNVRVPEVLREYMGGREQI